MDTNQPTNPQPENTPTNQPNKQPVETIPHVITPDPEMVAKAQESDKPSGKGTFALAIIAIIIVIVAVLVSLEQRQNNTQENPTPATTTVDPIAVDPANQRDFAEIEAFVQSRETPLSDSYDIDDVMADLEATEFHSINTDLVDLDAAQ